MRGPRPRRSRSPRSWRVETPPSPTNPPGLANLRDLGGLALTSGGETRHRAIWRSGHPDALDEDGWQWLIDVGIRTIVDLRNPEERSKPTPPSTVTIVSCPVEDPADPAYATQWDERWASPDFARWGIERWPESWAAVFDAIADAPDGGVLVHCAGGRDRTGIVVALLLDEAGAERNVVLDDYVRGIREADSRNIDAFVEVYQEQLDALLDEVDRGAAWAGSLRAAAGRLS